MSEEGKTLPEFANRAEYEKWKTEVLDHLRMEEEEHRSIWVCPSCLSPLPLSHLRCQCGYAAEQSFLRYFRGDVTPSELYETVRNEFHGGYDEMALFLSRYLIKRFPEALEAKHLREYRERAHRMAQPGQRAPRAMAGSPVSRSTKTVIAAVSAVFVCLALAAFFLWRLPGESTGQKPEQVRNLTGSTMVLGGSGGATAEKMLQEKKGTEGGEPERVRSPREELGFKKGRRIARIFLTNKPSEIRKKCYQAMMKTGLEDTEYLVGCMTGYDSHGLIWAHQPKVVDKGESGRGE
jgi:hypothetical protein